MFENLCMMCLILIISEVYLEAFVACWALNARRRSPNWHSPNIDVKIEGLQTGHALQH